MNENLTMKQVAEILNMSESFVKKACHQLGLKYYKIGRSVRIKKKDLEQWQKQRQAS